jgi:ABC-type nitrate/sulfonate/bicarbonate transport system ATPase subunit
LLDEPLGALDDVTRAEMQDLAEVVGDFDSATPLLVADANGLLEAEEIKAAKPVLLRSWAQ